MSKALEILNKIKNDKNYCNDCGGLNYCNNSNKNKICGMNVDIDGAISEIEAFQEENKILKHNYDVQVEYNNTAYKNYTNMVNSLEQRLEEAIKPKTCVTCKHCIDIAEHYYCNMINVDISNSTVNTFYCNRYKPKDNA